MNEIFGIEFTGVRKFFAHLVNCKLHGSSVAVRDFLVDRPVDFITLLQNISIVILRYLARTLSDSSLSVLKALIPSSQLLRKFSTSSGLLADKLFGGDDAVYRIVNWQLT